MATITEYFPPITDEPYVVGDPIAIKIEIVTEEDISGWTWEADLRQFPKWPVLASFDVLADPDLATGLILSLDATGSANLRNGVGFSLKRTDSVPVTWWICQSLRMVETYTGWPIESV